MIPSIPQEILDGLSSDLVLSGICVAIEAFSISGMLTDADVSLVECYRDLLLTSLKKADYHLHTIAAKAFSNFVSGQKVPENWLTELIQGVHPSQDAFQRCGYANALGRLPLSLIEQYSTPVIDALVQASQLSDQSSWNVAECRRDAILALNTILETLKPLFLAGHYTSCFEAIFSAFLNGAQDYSIETRGDVGSWVREGSLMGLEQILTLRSLLNSDQITCIVQQACLSCLEKIDRVRVTGGKLFEQALQSSNFVHGAELQSLVQSHGEMNWGDIKQVLPMMIKVFEYAPYRASILQGFVLCIGGLTETLVRHASDVFLTFFKGKDTSVLLESLNDLFNGHIQVDRVMFPLMETLELMLIGGLLDVYTQEALLQVTLSAIKQQVSKSKNMRKLLLTVKVYGALVGCCPVSTPFYTAVLKQLLLYTAHPYPKVRFMSCETLHLNICTGMVYQEPILQQCEDVILESAWEDKTKATAAKNQLKALLLCE